MERVWLITDEVFPEYDLEDAFYPWSQFPLSPHGAPGSDASGRKWSCER